MTDISKIGGVVPPLVTPLTNDRTLDVPGLERLVEHVLGGGVSERDGLRRDEDADAAA